MIPQGMIRTASGVLRPTPDWVRDMHRQGRLREGEEAFTETQMQVDHERLEFRGESTHADIVLRDGNDVIFQIYIGPKGQKLPLPDCIHELVTQALTAHFGTLDRFEGEAIPELRSFAIKARGLRGIPTYKEEFHLAGFLHFLDDCIAELE